MRIIRDVRYNNLENSFVDLFLPQQDSFDLMIWFHGGGFETGDRKNPVFASQLVDAGVGVASVEYRLYPHAKFPDFIEDCASAVGYILENAEKFGKVKRFFVAGQSAGAYVVLMLCVNPDYFEKAKVDTSKISGYIADSAQTTTHFNVLKERVMDSRLERIDDGAPLYYLNENTNVSNLLIIYYSNDMYCRAEQNELFYKSILRFCPNNNIKMVTLEGDHCNGSINKNEQGSYDFNNTVLEFIKDI